MDEWFPDIGIKPYYEDEAVVIFHGDCREILPLLPEATVDLVLTDPPYGVSLETKASDYRSSPFFDGGQSLKASTLYEDSPSYVRQLIPLVFIELSRITSRIVVFPGTANMWVYPEPTAVGGVFTPNGAGRSSWGFQCFHPILYYGKDPYLVDGKGLRPNSFKTEQPNKEHFDHPCPKPIYWLRWLIERCSRPTELILDPFLGSGTTARAAKDLGRKCIGIELEEKYCEIAAKRMAQTVMRFA